MMQSFDSRLITHCGRGVLCDHLNPLLPDDLVGHRLGLWRYDRLDPPLNAFVLNALHREGKQLE